ncbi:hypothetical protein SARC_04296 [Sphaeroforma arctica JP610]|uniref:Alcohol dehydrogenase-like C-terminal domain-containing protein n=1 Tax=Sphaeroforma arctica JP610 TaxID=667725 RepID=A0A0L0G2Z8_9EUKA|nr:hypothetical protein SARC_04296 [Sphaeroforma arctica JP610]KNC83455.1 hypothetical protein SARC_04296 [Sphaeroforma arctica JP610]|eukprot:XP_014157357.1 hypothetical protein SARC_04296 [Sphaeroforma arctica JP610]
MGPVGMLALLSAFKKGALPGRTFAIDCVPERLSKAKEIGAIPINFKEDSPQKVIMQHVGRLADSVLECVGSGPSLSTAFQLVRPGGTLSSIGVATDATLPFAPASCYDKNITLRFGRVPLAVFQGKKSPFLGLESRPDLCMRSRLLMSSNAHVCEIISTTSTRPFGPEPTTN